MVTAFAVGGNEQPYYLKSKEDMDLKMPMIGEDMQ